MQRPRLYKEYKKISCKYNNDILITSFDSHDYDGRKTAELYPPLLFTLLAQTLDTSTICKTYALM